MSSTDIYIQGKFIWLHFTLYFERFFILQIQFLAKYCVHSMHVTYFVQTHTKVCGEDLLCAQQTLQSGIGVPAHQPSSTLFKVKAIESEHIKDSENEHESSYS